MRTKHFIFILIISQIALISPAFSQGRPSSFSNDPFYSKALSELSDMLDGRAAPSIKRAAFLIEWAYLGGGVDYQSYCGQIEKMAERIRQFIRANQLPENPLGGNIALFEFFTNPFSMNGFKPFDYDFEDFSGKEDYTKLFVTKLLRTHSGQCRSLPLLYKILSDEIGAQSYIAYAPNHSFIRHRDPSGKGWVNVELTNGSLARDEFIKASNGISEMAVKRGTYLRACEDKEVIVNMLSELAIGYLRQSGEIEGFVQQCLGKIFRHDPDNLPGLMLANNSLCALLEQVDRAKDPDYVAALGFQLRDLEAQIKATGYVDMPAELYEQWAQSVEQEKQRRKSVNR